MNSGPARTAAEWIAEFVVARGVDRVYGLQGGHIQPIWDHLAQRKVRIVDVRDEGAAVHMAHCHAVLTGEVGIALVTAGPGVTNCVTAIANAQLERAPVLLIGGCAPIPQDDLGPLQGIDHVSIMKPVTRSARTLRTADNLLRDLDKAWSTAMGDGNPPGPVYVEIPTDVLRMRVPPGIVLPEYLAPKAPRRIPPEPQHVARAAALIGAARRPLVLTGRGAMGNATELTRFLDASGALYLDTQESRGLVPGTHPSFVGAVRARVMKEADLVIAIGRKLDYQTGYGSPAVFPNARWIRIADNAEELRENRRGEVELFAHPGLALEAMTASLPARGAVDTAWTKSMRDEHLRRSAKYAEELARAPAGNDGHMHPNRIFAALRKVLAPDAITIADGGDILSFARLGLDAPRTYLDAGTFGCLGVGYTVRCRGGAASSRPTSCRGQRRWRIRYQCDGDRQRKATRCQGGFHHRQQRGVEHRAARPADELRRPRRRYHARLERLRRHGARVRSACRARDGSGSARGRAPGGIHQGPGLARRGRDAGCAQFRRWQGARLGARLSGAHCLGRRREGAPAVSGVLNLGEIVGAHARLSPDKIAARDSRRAITFAQWNARACRLANALLGLGLQKGDRVALLAYNRLEWMEIYVALAKAGLVAVPINFRLVGTEISYIAEHCGARAFIVEDELIDSVEGSATPLPLPRAAGSGSATARGRDGPAWRR